MPTYRWKCTGCSLDIGVMSSIDERDDVPEWDCSCTTPTWERQVTSAVVTRASYIDGHKRKGFADLREAAKLESDMYNKPVGERSEHKRAIKELKKI